ENVRAKADALASAPAPLGFVPPPGRGGGGAGVGGARARLGPRLHAILDRLGVDFRPPSIEVERGTGPIALTAALPVPDDVRDPGDGAEAFELPGLERAATTVMRGGFDYRGAYQAVHDWIEQTGERAAGETREGYLDCDGPR